MDFWNRFRRPPLRKSSDSKSVSSVTEWYVFFGGVNFVVKFKTHYSPVDSVEVYPKAMLTVPKTYAYTSSQLTMKISSFDAR